MGGRNVEAEDIIIQTRCVLSFLKESIGAMITLDTNYVEQYADDVSFGFHLLFGAYINRLKEWEAKNKHQEEQHD